jgi:hypothetical protein
MWSSTQPTPIATSPPSGLTANDTASITVEAPARLPPSQSPFAIAVDSWTPSSSSRVPLNGVAVSLPPTKKGFPEAAPAPVGTMPPRVPYTGVWVIAGRPGYLVWTARNAPP